MANEDKILELLVDIKGSVDNLDKRVGNLEAKVDKIETRLDNLEAKVDKIETRLDNLEAKVDEVDKRLTAEIRDVNNRLVQVAIIQENEVLPKIELLLEGQTTMMETFAPKARVEALEEEIIYIKSDISMLKKAE